MKIISFSTRLTPTAIGQSGTNDSYIYFPKEDYITELFYETQSTHTIDFTDMIRNKTHTLNMVFSRENRLYKFGPYAREMNLNPGDELILQRVIENGESKYFFNYVRFEDIIVFRCIDAQKHFVTWNDDRLQQWFPQFPYDILIKTIDGEQTVTIEYSGKKKERRDAATELDTYRLDGLDKFLDFNKLKSRHKLILQKVEGQDSYYITSRPINWEFTVVEIERGKQK